MASRVGVGVGVGGRRAHCGLEGADRDLGISASSPRAPTHVPPPTCPHPHGTLRGATTSVAGTGRLRAAAAVLVGAARRHSPVQPGALVHPPSVPGLLKIQQPLPCVDGGSTPNWYALHELSVQHAAAHSWSVLNQSAGARGTCQSGTCGREEQPGQDTREGGREGRQPCSGGMPRQPGCRARASGRT